MSARVGADRRMARPRRGSQPHINPRKSPRPIERRDLRHSKLKAPRRAVCRRLCRGVAPLWRAHDMLPQHRSAKAHPHKIALALLPEGHIMGLPAVAANPRAPDPARRIARAALHNPQMTGAERPQAHPVKRLQKSGV